MQIILRKQCQVGRLHVKVEWRSSRNLMGRFGGGWNWEVGIQVGGSTLIVNLLIASVRFDWRKPVEVN